METLDKLNLNKTSGGNLKKNTTALGMDNTKLNDAAKIATSHHRKKAFPMPVSGNYYLKGPIVKKAPPSGSKTSTNNVELPKYCSYTPNKGFFCDKLDNDKSTAITIKTYNKTSEKQAMFSTTGGWCGSSSNTPGKIVCDDKDMTRYVNFDPY